MTSSNLLCVLVFLNLPFITVSVDLYDTPNVKTALFYEMDVRRSCWNHDEINLLRARMIMQDLIPKKIPRDIPYLLEYLRGTEEAVVRHSPEGKVRRIMMLALSDVLGGYIQAVALPLAKEAYYAGNIDYATMSRLYELLNEMKSRLRTDGGTWSRPLDMTKFSVKVTALHLPMENSELACKAMIVTPAESCAPGFSRISIPYLDYDVKPGAVALPLKSRNLYSLKTAASSHIIVRFYILGRQCLSQMPPSDTERFNYHFMTWLTVKVVPHLYEDIWYPGFGSIMRIVETVNETEIFNHAKPLYVANDTSLEKSLISGKTCGFASTVRSILKYHFWWAIVLALIALLLVLFFLFCAWWAFTSYTGGYTYLGEKSSSGILNAVLSIYCGLKDKEDSKEESKKGSLEVSGHFKPSDASYRRSTQKSQPTTYYPPMKPSSDTSTIPSTSEDEESTVSST